MLITGSSCIVSQRDTSFWSPCLALYWSGIMERKKRPAVCRTRSNDGAHSRRGNRASKLLLQPI